MVKSLLIIAFLSGTRALGATDPCSYFKYCSSGSTSSKSLPSSSSAANFNPSNISKIKGVGVETLFQKNNPLAFNFVSGTGKVGGALISSTLENSFFGNRSIETDQDYLQRRVSKKRYKNKKLSVALGFSVLDKQNYSLSLGVSAKRNPSIKKINPGLAVSGKIRALHFGAFFYKDDVKLDFQGQYNYLTGVPYDATYGSTYQETFSVQTYSLGTKLGNLMLDFGVINTKYKFYPEPTKILIYSSAYNLGNFLFNFAYRQENSSNLAEENGQLVYKPRKNSLYYGLQYSFNRHFILGVAYNHFLLKEASATVTIFL